METELGGEWSHPAGITSGLQGKGQRLNSQDVRPVLKNEFLTEMKTVVSSHVLPRLEGSAGFYSYLSQHQLFFLHVICETMLL